MSIGIFSTHFSQQIVLLTAGLAFGFFVFITFFAFKRQGEKRRTLKIIAHFLAVFSLLAIFLQPKYQTAPKPVGALLITPGANAKTLKALRDSLAFGEFVFSLDPENDWRTIFPGLKTVPDVLSIPRNFPEITTLHIAGSGLKSFDFAALKNIRIVPVLSGLPPGVYLAPSKKTLAAGEIFHPRGRVKNAREDSSRILLSDYGGVVDSAIIDAESPTSFSLRARPHESGNFLYDLAFVSELGDTLQKEKIGVSVAESTPLRFLMIESAPKFETRFLKKYLIDQGHRLALRSAISKERFRTEFFNFEEQKLDKITAKILARTDLLIIDGVSLKALSSAEKRALQNAVFESGLGVLILADNVVLSRKRGAGLDFFLPFAFERIAELDERLVRPQLDGGAIPPLPAPPFFLLNTPGVKPILMDAHGKMLCAAKRIGAGQVAVSLIANTYRWALAGKADLHARFWSSLAPALARRDEKKDVIRLETHSPVFLDEPLKIAVFSPKKNPDLWLEESDESRIRLGLAQRQNDASHWQGVLWPVRTGWHVLKSGNGGELSFYVHDGKSWSTLQAEEKSSAVRRHVNHAAADSAINTFSSKTEKRAVPRLWFFVIFILSMGFLWIESKF